MQTIWTEKFRPHSFDQVKGQVPIVNRVKAMVKKQNIPHLLFTGPAGVGKTTLALVVARELYGDEWRENIMELNASDERGIDVIRVNVKNFARTKALGNFPFKLIYLDECDALTREAQQALRRTMENYAQTCRFVLSCNYSSKIIDPIQSRCTIFRFKPLSKEEIFTIVDTISKEENLSLDETAREALYSVTDGDVRRMQNILQSCASVADTITDKVIFDIASVAEPKEVKIFLDMCVAGNFHEAKKKMLSTKLDYGLSGIDLIKQIQQTIWELDIEDAKKLQMVSRCGEAEFRLVEGSDEIIQLEALLSDFLLAK